MSSKLQQIGGNLLSVADTDTAAPSGDVGMELSQSWDGGSRPNSYLLTIVITTGAADVTLWGCVRHLGASDTPADDQWGKHTDRRRAFPQGVLGSALPVGTYHFVLEDVGLYTRLYVQKSANNVACYLRPIQFAGRGN